MWRGTGPPTARATASNYCWITRSIRLIVVRCPSLCTRSAPLLDACWKYPVRNLADCWEIFNFVGRRGETRSICFVLQNCERSMNFNQRGPQSPNKKGTIFFKSKREERVLFLRERKFRVCARILNVARTKFTR